MRSVTLSGTGIRTTALGFGTASLMGRLGRRSSLRLLSAAYDQGIRHFDTAPSYGYGEAEDVLGEFARSKSDITLTTKFGLGRPRARALWFRGAKWAARPFLRTVPALRERARTVVADRVPVRATFDPAEGRRSLAESLRRLRRDTVDLFLLHECRESDLRDDGLVDFLSAAKDRGDIRAFGIASDFLTVASCVSTKSVYSAVVQLPNNIAQRNLEQFPLIAQDRACITHSPFGGSRETLPDPPEVAFRYALQSNVDGIVLFASQRVEHIAANVSMFECLQAP